MPKGVLAENFHPGHYVLLVSWGSGIDPNQVDEMERELRGVLQSSSRPAAIRGVQIRYAWRDFERDKGAFDFTKLREHARMLRDHAAKGGPLLRLNIQLQTFENSPFGAPIPRAVPDDMVTGPSRYLFQGCWGQTSAPDGVDAQGVGTYQGDARYCTVPKTSAPTPYGQMTLVKDGNNQGRALLWQPNVLARFRALLSAIADELETARESASPNAPLLYRYPDGSHLVESIVMAETSFEVGERRGDRERAGYTPRRMVRALEQILETLELDFVNRGTVAIQYMNFLPGLRCSQIADRAFFGATLPADSLDYGARKGSSAASVDDPANCWNLPPDMPSDASFDSAVDTVDHARVTQGIKATVMSEAQQIRALVEYATAHRVGLGGPDIRTTPAPTACAAAFSDASISDVLSVHDRHARFPIACEPFSVPAHEAIGAVLASGGVAMGQGAARVNLVPWSYGVQSEDMAGVERFESTFDLAVDATFLSDPSRYDPTSVSHGVGLPEVRPNYIVWGNFDNEGRGIRISGVYAKLAALPPTYLHGVLPWARALPSNVAPLTLVPRAGERVRCSA